MENQARKWNQFHVRQLRKYNLKNLLIFLAILSKKALFLAFHLKVRFYLRTLHEKCFDVYSFCMNPINCDNSFFEKEDIKEAHFKAEAETIQWVCSKPSISNI